MTSSMGRAFAEFCITHGVDPERFKSVIADAYGGGGPDGMVALLERGRVELGEFERWLARELSGDGGAALDPTGLKERIFAGMQPDERMVDVVATLRHAGVKTALVSNSWGSTTYDQARGPDLFDVVVISGEVGLRKPDADIYLLAAERLGVMPAKCVFVDDLLHNVEGAQAVGMEALVHRSAEFTIPELETLFGVSLG